MYYKTETNGNISVYAKNQAISYPYIRVVGFSDNGVRGLLMDNKDADVSSMTPISFG